MFFTDSHATNRIGLTTSDDIESAIRFLREQRPNAQNKEELNKLMEITRNHRRSWINTSFPSITKIVNQYPRLLDMPESILKEFQSSNCLETRLHVEWQKYKPKILEYAKSKPSLNTLMFSVTNELDEEKSELSVLSCLASPYPTTKIS
ncbi:uncharacterized protein LOC136075407 isoform X2 [Hydra vulgaris]|uniref:Uncharacterized protein LOC136075407 isoform X2 n=1 Tax=Hydra vulgaris TaxID=6087 RepID=A0ABM4B6R8_HYDVU